MRELGQIAIHKAASNDLPKIVHHMEPTGSTPLYPFSNLAKLQNIPLDGLIVCEFQSEYAGFLYWYLEVAPDFDPEVKKYGYIEELQVLERFQRKGVGRKMLGYALEKMKESGVQAIYLRTREGNTPAQNLYESVGFRPFSRHIRYKLNIS